MCVIQRSLPAKGKSKPLLADSFMRCSNARDGAYVVWKPDHNEVVE
jgi:hypothetical protein